MFMRTYLLCSVCLFVCSGIALAQMTTATVTGIVRDATGAVVPGVSVQVKNIDTGISRVVTTDAGGRYRVPQLSLGNYEAQAELSGFKTEVRRGIKLNVGTEAVVDFSLEIGQVSENITVTGEAPLVEQSGATISALVGEREMADLPLNGRSFDQLITTDSGAAYFRFESGGSSQGFGTKFTINGQRWESNKFYQDGTEMIGASRTSDVPGSASGLQLGVDAIREFRVLSNNYSAEYGKKVGGIISTVTKSGTNELHGSAFEFHRNDNFDARNFFDRGAPPEFKRNNFGASLGGPIKRDKLFLFGNYEGLRQRLGITKIAIVPDANARTGLLPDSRTGELVQFPVNAAVVPYLSLFPLPDGRNFRDGTAESFNPAATATNENYGTSRFDYNISDKDSLFVSYTINDADLTNPLANRFFAQPATTRNHRATVEEKHIFSPSLLNVFRVGFNRSSYALDTVSLIDIDPSLSFSPGLKFGSMAFRSGMTNVSDLGGPNANTNNIFQYSDQVIYMTGQHSFTFGAQIQRFQRNELSTDLQRGDLTFDTLADFLAGKSSLVRIAVPPQIRGTLNIGLDLDSNYVKGWRQTYGGIYAQDSWKATPNLSLDLGLRYEFLTNPHEVNGRTLRYDYDKIDPTGKYVRTHTIVGGELLDDPARVFAPRVGLAWDPFGDGKSSIRAGFGVFYEQFDNQYRFFQDINPPFSASARFTNPPFPRPLEGLSAGAITVVGRMVDPGIRPATVFQYNLGLQRELLNGLVVRLTYIGSRGYHLTDAFPANLAPADILADGRKFWPAGRPLANPIWGSIYALEANSSAWYNSLKFETEKRFGSGALSNLRFKFAYSFARSIDIASTMQSSAGTNTSGRVLDPLDLPRDKGLSGLDIRHNAAFNFTYDLPQLFASGLGARLLNDWSTNGIVLANTGFPNNILAGFNVSRDRTDSPSDRPDLAPGANNSPVLGGPDRYFDPSGFVLGQAGFYGNLGRNTLIGPGLANFDFSLTKGIPVSERYRLLFRAEFFNLLNRANFGIPARTLFTSNGQRVGSAGRISNTVTTSREIQFGLRFEF